jgi:hypothetical protein
MLRAEKTLSSLSVEIEILHVIVACHVPCTYVLPLGKMKIHESFSFDFRATMAHCCGRNRTKDLFSAPTSGDTSSPRCHLVYFDEIIPYCAD